VLHLAGLAFYSKTVGVKNRWLDTHLKLVVRNTFSVFLSVIISDNIDRARGECLSVRGPTIPVRTRTPLVYPFLVPGKGISGGIAALTYFWQPLRRYNKCDGLGESYRFLSGRSQVA
jgi:hypothetical protein